MQSITYTLKPQDNKTSLYETIGFENKKMEIPVIIVLKKNILVEVIGGNYVEEYGLINGAKTIFRNYIEDKLDIVCIEFKDPRIGLVQRQAMCNLFTNGFFHN